jgi:hypothetical protein
MVFLLARVVQSAFTDAITAHGIQQKIEEWYSSKPHTFDPIRSAPRGPELDQRFPTIWMLLPVHGENLPEGGRVRTDISLNIW